MNSSRSCGIIAACAGAPGENPRWVTHMCRARCVARWWIRSSAPLLGYAEYLWATCNNRSRHSLAIQKHLRAVLDCIPVAAKERFISRSMNIQLFDTIAFRIFRTVDSTIEIPPRSLARISGGYVPCCLSHIHPARSVGNASQGFPYPDRFHRLPRLGRRRMRQRGDARNRPHLLRKAPRLDADSYRSRRLLSAAAAAISRGPGLGIPSGGV